MRNIFPHQTFNLLAIMSLFVTAVVLHLECKVLGGYSVVEGTTRRGVEMFGF